MLLLHTYFFSYMNNKKKVTSILDQSFQTKNGNKKIHSIVPEWDIFNLCINNLHKIW